MLPTHARYTKLGANGKGPRAMVVKQSSMRIILGCTAILLLLSGCLWLDIKMERSAFTSGLKLEHAVEEHQRHSKLEAESKMTEAAALLSEQVDRSNEEESSLKIMVSHILYVQHEARTRFLRLADGSNGSDGKGLKKQLAAEFDKLNEDVSSIMKEHLSHLHDTINDANASLKQLQIDVVQELEKQEHEDRELELDSTNTKKATEGLITGRLNAVFNHVYELAGKMGATDIDDLLKESNVQEMTQVLADTESGKLSYPDGIKQMEGILEKAPAALKLAEATGSIALVEADGGKKGVDEVTNFRALLKEVKRLPQYAAVLEEFEAWKSGKRTEQQVLLWVQQKIANSELDADWITLASAPFVESDPRKMAQGHKSTKKNKGSATAAAASVGTTAAAAATATATIGPGPIGRRPPPGGSVPATTL